MKLPLKKPLSTFLAKIKGSPKKMDRVVSKNLFNYTLLGEFDADALTSEKALSDELELDTALKELFNQINSEDVNADCVASFLRERLKKCQKTYDDGFKEGINNCIHSDITTSPQEENNIKISILVHTPMALIENNKNPAIVFAHGGGCVAGSAELFKGPLSQLALEIGVVIFNVDYRLAPETKHPHNVGDFYHAVKYITENAKELGVDPLRIGIAGEGGGGYICLSTMVMLSQKDEEQLVKLAIPVNPMTSDYCFGDKQVMTKEERMSANANQKLWKCIAEDIEGQKGDPVLFPGKANEELLKKMPPTIMWVSEFDKCITEGTRLARRLRNEGRLLELRVHPGATCESMWLPDSKACRDNMADFKKAIEAYLL